jgi:hypothetical protein
MKGMNGFQYEVGHSYHHPGSIELCKSGFHFSYNPLQCLAYSHQLDQPYRLLVVRGSENIECGDDKLCSSQLYIEKEITDQKEKDELLTGISITDKVIECYKNGQLHNPAPGVYAKYSSPDPNTHQCIQSWENGSLINLRFSYSLKWPPKVFESIIPRALDGLDHFF